MNRRTERIGKLLQHEIGKILIEKLADPRIDAARTSITRVKVQEDLLAAKVYVSIIGTEAQQRRCIEALERAAGRIRILVRDEVRIRYMPALVFVADQQFKETLETWNLIRQAMDEIHDREDQQEDSPEQI